MAEISNVYLLIGNIQGEVSYGFDESDYIFGIYTTKEEAKKAKEEYKASDKLFMDKDGGCLFIGFMGMINNTLEVDDEDATGQTFMRYKDFFYRIVEFNTAPAYIGGGSYLE